MKTLYLAVTRDRYALPLAVADTPEELAELVGSTKKNIIDSIRLSEEQNAERPRYIRVQYTDEEWSEDNNDD